MLLPIPDEILHAQARDRALDAVLGSLGVTAAVASASFAGYMMLAGPMRGGERNTSPALVMAAVPQHAPRAIAAPPHGGLDVAPAEPDLVDFDPTGSIAVQPGDPQDGDAEAQNPDAVLPDFAVRDAFDGTALVEARGTLQMVQPGTMLAGAGKVLSIARNGKGWKVATTGGIILQRR